ncbi:hypothetical protein XcodCFBP4690_06015 [Xanthomonas codiaei]|uniref:Uncharacterized protein n=1 Tax=Xanthomonas codiaei TaxID=56463 RepID=A0A2S7CU60_9XANT|nr:hypothetical protein XcodCFBP4690_06015 [Xanthomonas codiaei]
MRGALTACGTRRESVRGGSVAASMPPHGPASGEDTAPDGFTGRLGMSQTQRASAQRSSRRVSQRTVEERRAADWRESGQWAVREQFRQVLLGLPLP